MKVIRALLAVVAYLIGYAFVFALYSFLFGILIFVLSKILGFAYHFYYSLLISGIIICIMGFIQIDIIAARRSLAPIKNK